MLPRRGRVLAPSAAAGLLLAASLPPWGWWPLAFVGTALLYWRLDGLRWRARALAGWMAGLGCFVPGLWWAWAFNWYGAAVLMAVEALSMGAAALLVPSARWRAPAFVGAFTLLEALRTSWPFGGLPLGGLFLGQAGGPLLPVARLGGPLLMDALVWLGGVGVATAACGLARWTGVAPIGRDRWASGASPRSAAALRTAAAAVALVVGLAGAARAAPAGGATSGHLSIALVQGGGRRGVGHQDVAPRLVFAAEAAASRRLLDAPDPPKLVVWPEDAVAVGPRLAGTTQAAYLSGLARRLRATVLAGVTETVSARAFRNEAVAWGPSGRVVGVYQKVHRVPFGEYVPFRSFFAHFASLSAVPLDALPGHGTGELSSPAGRLGIMISYEVFFAARGRSAVRAGASLLVVPTNTSSYATDQVPLLEVAADRTQAVAEGRDLVQAAPTGYSTVVDDRGVVVARSGLGDRQVLRATVALRTGRTLYEVLGDLPVIALAALAVVLSILAAAFARPPRSGPHS